MNSHYNEKDIFFSKERRIEENRNRLKELYEQFKRTENYYPIFLAYITAVGLYLFDFVVAFLKDSYPWYFIAITVLTVISIIYVLVLIWKFFKSVEWHSDYLPYGVYEEFPAEIIIDKPELNGNEDLLREELYDRYIKDLEEFVEKDLEIYILKRNRLKKIWIPMIISLFIYSINITAYKVLSDNFKSNESLKVIIMSPRKIIINENQNSVSDSTKNKTSKHSIVRDNKQQEKNTQKSNASKKENPKK